CARRGYYGFREYFDYW
nr:immunoglobulin heavy chain junction region [Mus musculus]MBK4186051.1 immunoglobulin heavy chain junction region [Mus musculus]MBK4186052.1 immunoglobulin heavy chain junction region [Mus musculus]